MEAVWVESRKLQRVGTQTISVTLPINWVRENELKRGDFVFLVPEGDGSLKIYPNELIKPAAAIEECICNADLCDSKMLERIIVGKYILGCDIYTIISSTRIRSEHIEEVRSIVRKLIGMGIVEEVSDRITLQCSVDPKRFHIDMLLRRLSIIATTIIKEGGEALQNFDVSLANEAKKREDEADTMYFLSMRMLMSAQKRSEIAKEIGLKDPSQILYFGLILRYLELIADYADEMASRVVALVQNYKDKLPKRVLERMGNLIDLAHDLVVQSMDVFFIGDIKIANSLLETRTFIELERERLMQELPEIPHLRLMLYNIKRIADNGAGIATVAINNALERKTALCSTRLLTNWSTSLK